MHVSIAVTLIIIILFAAAGHAARTLTVQEAEVSAAGGGQELRQLPRLDPREEDEVGVRSSADDKARKLKPGQSVRNSPCSSIIPIL